MYECTNENKQHSQENKFFGTKTILTSPYKMFLRGLRAGPGPQKVWEPLVYVKELVCSNKYIFHYDTLVYSIILFISG